MHGQYALCNAVSLAELIVSNVTDAVSVHTVSAKLCQDCPAPGHLFLCTAGMHSMRS